MLNLYSWGERSGRKLQKKFETLRKQRHICNTVLKLPNEATLPMCLNAKNFSTRNSAVYTGAMRPEGSLWGAMPPMKSSPFSYKTSKYFYNWSETKRKFTLLRLWALVHFFDFSFPHFLKGKPRQLVEYRFPLSTFRLHFNDRRPIALWPSADDVIVANSNNILRWNFSCSEMGCRLCENVV